MKIVQSFWSGNDVKRDFGWFSEKHHLLGWILSAVQLNRYYDDVTLYTDDAGYDVLIDKLKLPYKSCERTLESLNNNSIDHNLWAYAKIQTYNTLNVPFLHVDGDVFIWEQFNEKLLTRGLIVQNQETTSDYYRDMWNMIKPHLDFVPYEMLMYDKELTKRAYNMGVFGGHDMSFIKEYSEAAIHFVEGNRLKLPKDQRFNFNIFFEQVLLYNKALLENKKVHCLINDDIGDNEYKNFGNFDEVPTERKYLHLLGFFKREFVVCNKLDIYVQKYFPEYYNNLEEYLGLSNRLSNFGFKYSSSDIDNYSNRYLESVEENHPVHNKAEAIFSRNMLTEGQVLKYENLLAKNKHFVLLKLTHFVLDTTEQLIKIETVDDLMLELPALSIDYVIFDVIGEKISKQQFAKEAISYLDESFPVEEKDNFVRLLWQRISIFISLGIIYVQEQNKLNKNFHERKQEEVDA